MDKRKMINLITKGLILDGYKSVGKGAGSTHLIKKEKNGIIKKINFPYTVYPNKYYLRGYISADISYPSVENLLKKYCTRYKLGYTNRTVYMTSSKERLSEIPIVNFSGYRICFAQYP